MKLATLATVITATAGFAAAQQHGHAHHQHLHKRDVVVTVYEMDGHILPAAEVLEGIANGTYVWDLDSGKVAQAKVALPAVEAAKVAVKGSPALAHLASAPSKPAAAPAPAYSTPSNPTPQVASTPSTGTGLGSDFPSGELSCSTFPSQYGALAVDYLGLGGWLSVQAGTLGSGGFSDIVTMVSSQCSGSDCCKEGAYCSYACPAGYEKTQWPTTQGSTGQSVGGLLCNNGKLETSNPAFKTLCALGNTAVKVEVRNTMGASAAICRTNYPGDEGETIPLDATPGSVTPLTTPDADTYYHWEGAATSAQYYVNNAGVSVSEACQWGTMAENAGNFAPMNIGAGYSDGAAWLSIFQNLPTTDAKLDFTVELVGDNGGYDNLIGRCKYSNGQYCSGDSYEDCSSTVGCTVNVKTGTATFVLSS